MGRQLIKIISALFFAITASAVLYVGYWYMNIERAKTLLTDIVSKELGHEVSYAFMQPMGFPLKVKFRFDDVRLVTENSKLQFDQLYVDASLLAQNVVSVNLPKTFNVLLESEDGSVRSLKVSLEGGEMRIRWDKGPHKITIQAWNASVRDREFTYVSGADLVIDRLAYVGFPYAKEAKWEVSMNSVVFDHPDFIGMGKEYESLHLKGVLNRLKESDWLKLLSYKLTTTKDDDQKIAQILRKYPTDDLMELEELKFQNKDSWFIVKGNLGQDETQRVSGRVTLITNRGADVLKDFVSLDMISEFDLEESIHFQDILKHPEDLQTLKLEGQQGRFIFNGKPFENAPYVSDLIRYE